MEHGIVKFFNSKKRYGFIINDLDNLDYFFGEKNCLTPVDKDDKVTFNIVKTGPRPFAINVQLDKLREQIKKDYERE